jgi:hypothetical protein
MRFEPHQADLGKKKHLFSMFFRYPRLAPLCPGVGPVHLLANQG